MGLLLNMAELKCVFIAWLIHVTKKNFGLVLWTLYIVGVELFSVGRSFFSPDLCKFLIFLNMTEFTTKHHRTRHEFYDKSNSD